MTRSGLLFHYNKISAKVTQYLYFHMFLPIPFVFQQLNSFDTHCPSEAIHIHRGYGKLCFEYFSSVILLSRSIFVVLYEIQDNYVCLVVRDCVRFSTLYEQTALLPSRQKRSKLNNTSYHIVTYLTIFSSLFLVLARTLIFSQLQGIILHVTLNSCAVEVKSIILHRQSCLVPALPQKDTI